MSVRGLHKEGYVIWRNLLSLPADAVERGQIFVNHGGECIFNHNEDHLKRNDMKRRQRVITDENEFGDITQPLEAFLITNFPNHVFPLSWHVLGSAKGCERQAAHCDYLPSQEFFNCSPSQIPLVVLVAIENNTYFDVWPRSIGLHTKTPSALHLPTLTNSLNIPLPIHRETITLNKGDVIVFRGDLVHGGAAFADSNVRLHGYIDSKIVPRVRDQTWLVHRDACAAMKALLNLQHGSAGGKRRNADGNEKRTSNRRHSKGDKQIRHAVPKGPSKSTAKRTIPAMCTNSSSAIEGSGRSCDRNIRSGQRIGVAAVDSRYDCSNSPTVKRRIMDTASERADNVVMSREGGCVVSDADDTATSSWKKKRIVSTGRCGIDETPTPAVDVCVGTSTRSIDLVFDIDVNSTTVVSRPRERGREDHHDNIPATFGTAEECLDATRCGQHLRQ